MKKKHAPVAQQNRAEVYEASGSEFESQQVLHCFKCDLHKPKKEFYTKDRKDWCKACHRIYRKEHYNKNKLYYGKKARKSEARIRKRLHNLVTKFLESNPCVDCKITDWRVLSFDHVRGDKVAAISEMIIKQRPWEVIKAEIDKCVVRCMNCHRIKTAKQFNYYGYNTAQSA